MVQANNPHDPISYAMWFFTNYFRFFRDKKVKKEQKMAESEAKEKAAQEEAAKIAEVSKL